MMPTDPKAVEQMMVQRRAGLQAQDRMLQFFSYDHLPPNLQEASRPFCDHAYHIVEHYPRNPERTVTLRKLLEAKDAAVRTLLYKET